MKNSILLKTGLFLIFSWLVANSGALASTDVIAQQWVNLDKAGKALVTTRKIEGKLGRPYTMELRISCDKEKNKNWETLDVVDSESVCDVKPKSAKLTKDGKHISVLIRETDADAYNAESKRVDAKALGEIQPQCKKQAKQFLFSVENYCNR